MQGNGSSSVKANAHKQILVVEDEKDLLELLCLNLRREGYVCRSTADGRAAIAEAERQPPDLVLLDRMLPGTSGDEVARRLRSAPRTAQVPIVMLTAKSAEVDQVVGLSIGADDYITKPFSMAVLLARIAALLRRSQVGAPQSPVLTLGPVVLDADRHEATVHGASISLTATEFRLLRALMAAQGRVLSRNQLIDKALGEGVVVTDRTIDVHVTALRKKMGEGGQWVCTVRGVGYTFRDPNRGE